MIQILMSTYNGYEYIFEQLKSIENQTYKDISIKIRDDGSKDKTIEEIEKFKDKLDITILCGENIKPARSFIELVRCADDAEYYAFCDQDDVWLPEKLEIAIKQISKYNQNEPILYFSDTTLVDKDLNKLSNVKKINKLKLNLGSALIENVATGCTIVFNKALREKLKKIDDSDIEEGFLHDSLAYRVCFSIGKVIYDENSYILYRQHSKNVVGNSSSKKDKFFLRLKGLKKNMKMRLRSNMAKKILNIYSYDISIKNKKIIEKIAYSNKFINKIKIVFDFKIRRMSRTDDIMYRFAVMFLGI